MEFWIGMACGFLFGCEFMRWGVLRMASAYGRGERWGEGQERVAAMFRGDRKEPNSPSQING